MTKTGQTKNEILNLIATGNKTLSEISQQLDLAPSTVSQHLQELKESGAISEVDNPYIKKWKYYKLNPEFNYNAHNYNVKHIVQNKVPRPLYYFAFILIAVSAGYFAFASMAHAASSAQSNLPLMLTDPPIVPNGTTALYINYSSVGVHLAGKGNSSSPWIYSNSSSSVDLMSLINVSQVIGNVKINDNSTINLVRFNITSAWIVINGTTYDVAVPNGRLTAKVTEGHVNGSSSVLIDLSPVIATVYTANSSVFVMVPSLKAVIIAQANKSNTKALSSGTSFQLKQSDLQKLAASKPNISITSAALVQYKDNLYVQVTVENNGNSSAILNHVLVIGNENPMININNTCSSASNSSSGTGWCRILAGGKLVGIETHGSAGAREGFDSANLGIISNLPVPIARGGGSAGGSAGAGSGSGSGSGSAGDSAAASNGAMPLPQPRGTFSISVPFAGSSNGTISGHRFGFNSSDRTFNSSEWSNLSDDIHVTLPFSTSAGNMLANGTIRFNSSAVYGIIAPRAASKNPKAEEQFVESADRLRALSFIVQQNGSLDLQAGIYSPQRNHSEMAQASAAAALQGASSGYSLGPGQSATLTYSAGVIFPGNLSISLVPGSKYKIILIGEDGAYASVGLNAS